MNDSPLRLLSLCSGIGGIDLAAEWAGMEIVGQVEIDPFCVAVLEKHWPHVKRMSDIRKVHGDEFGPIDILVGGIPCQPWSVAGQQRGAEDERHLWPAMRRIIADPETGLGAWPTWVVIENVAGFARLALDDICTDLEFLGYAVTAYLLPAAAVGAPHQRERIFIVAHANRGQCHRRQGTRLGGIAAAQSPCWCDAGRCGDDALADTSTRGIRCGRPSRATRQSARGGESVADARRERQSTGRASSGATPLRTLQHDRAGGGGEAMANTTGARLAHRELTRECADSPQGRRGMEPESERCGTVVYTSGTGQQERHTSRVASDAGHTARRCHPQRNDRQTEPRLGGATHGLPGWLDADTRWPAGPGEAQHDWEAPRTTTGATPHRAARLKALGNAVVPQQVYPILAAIAAVAAEEGEVSV